MSNIVQPTKSQLDGLVASYIQNQPTGLGFVIGYASPSFESIFLAGNLVNQRQEALSLTADTPFELASVSKTFTATLYALLIEGQSNQNLTLGDFSLDIGSQFLNIPIVDLVTYTSGLPQDNDTVTDLPPFLPTPYSVAGMLGYLNFTGLTPGAAGKKYTYSNLAFGIMGGALAPQLAGASDTYEDLVAENLFAPLGMSSTFFEDVRLDRLPLGYEYSGTEYAAVSAGWPGFPAYNGAGGVVASANDMMQWLKFNMGLVANDKLTPLLSKLQSPATKVLTPWGDSLGLGWFLTLASGSTFGTVWKDGDLSGYSSYIAFLPSSAPGEVASQAGVFVLTNSGGINDASGTEICASFANDVLYYMQGLTPPSDKSLYPRSAITRPIIR